MNLHPKEAISSRTSIKNRDGPPSLYRQHPQRFKFQQPINAGNVGQSTGPPYGLSSGILSAKQSSWGGLSQPTALLPPPQQVSRTLCAEHTRPQRPLDHHRQRTRGHCQSEPRAPIYAESIRLDHHGEIIPNRQLHVRNPIASAARRDPNMPILPVPGAPRDVTLPIHGTTPSRGRYPGVLRWPTTSHCNCLFQERSRGRRERGNSYANRARNRGLR